MAAQYPSVVRTFSRRQDSRDIVVANDVNVVYDEVEEIETQLGVGGVVTSNWTSGSSFTTATTDWRAAGGLKSRLDNIELGVVSAINNAVSTSGGSTITASSSSTTGLIIKGASSQTANLIDFRNSSNTSLASVSSAGKLTAVLIDGGSA